MFYMHRCRPVIPRIDLVDLAEASISSVFRRPGVELADFYMSNQTPANFEENMCIPIQASV